MEIVKLNPLKIEEYLWWYNSKGILTNAEAAYWAIDVHKTPNNVFDKPALLMQLVRGMKQQKLNKLYLSNEFVDPNKFAEIWDNYKEFETISVPKCHKKLLMEMLERGAFEFSCDLNSTEEMGIKMQSLIEFFKSQL